MRFLTVLAPVALICAISLSANAKKEDKEDKRIEAKVWFKDGRVYQGEMPKHWLTYGQTFLASGHNFHILSDQGKNVKCQVKDVDSILIVSSSHEKFVPGDFYLPAEKFSAYKKTKLVRRIKQGRYVDFCRMPYIGNCQVAGMQMDQRMEYWLVRFSNDGKTYFFFDNPLNKGCHKPKFYVRAFYNSIKKSYPDLAEAVMARFDSDDKKKRKAIAQDIAENPEILVDFVDQYLIEHSR